MLAGIAIGMGICLVVAGIVAAPLLLMGYSEWASERKSDRLRRKYGDRYWENEEYLKHGR